MNGVLILNKPRGFTSFDAVAVVRKYSGQRKIGHTGTLDPNATGVLPLLLGNATKAQAIISNHDKEYVAGFRLGLTTDTLDVWGEKKTEKESYISKKDIEAVIPEFTGEITQIPPMFSAVQQGGRRLYELARKGVEVQRESRKVTVYMLKLLSFDESSQTGQLFVFCSKGTYIRTLIDDIGARLKVGGVMTSLNRTMACGYTIDSSLTIDEVKTLAENNLLKNKLISTESLFLNFQEIFVSDAQANRFYNGGSLDCERTYLSKIKYNEGAVFRVKSRDKRFFGLGIVQGDKLKVYKHF